MVDPPAGFDYVSEVKNKTNNTGDSEQPCLTPQVIGTASVSL